MLIEFQGEFEHSEIIDGQFKGIELGRLTEKNNGAYELKVGNHLLRGKSDFDSANSLLHAGKVQNLPRPMVMTERKVQEDGTPKMVIQAEIRKKINFPTRPTPLR